MIKNKILLSLCFIGSLLCFVGCKPTEPEIVSYTVNYYSKSGEKITTETVQDGKSAECSVNIEDYVEDYKLYSFDHWVDDQGNDMTSSLGAVNQDLDVYPFFTHVNITPTVTFQGVVYEFNNETASYEVTGYDEETLLENIVFLSAIESFSVTKIDLLAFNNCSILKEVTIPASITSSNKAFKSCSNLATVHFAEGTQVIDQFTLYQCTALTSVNIPEGVVEIKDSAFEGCTALQTIALPNTLTTIGYGGFKGCTAIENISIPNSVVSMGKSVFFDCSKLETITLSTQLTAIGGHTFYRCSLSSIVIPEGVETIGENAFDGCDVLTSVSLPTTMSQISANAFYGCSALKSITLPNGLTKIYHHSFANTGLVEVNIPNGVEEIEYRAFLDCTDLKEISIPDSVKTIGDYAFRYCSKLTSITLPSSLESIGNNAFESCSKLEVLDFSSVDSVVEIGTNLFKDTTQEITVYVPASLQTAWQADETWIATGANITIKND